MAKKWGSKNPGHISDDDEFVPPEGVRNHLERPNTKAEYHLPKAARKKMAPIDRDEPPLKAGLKCGAPRRASGPKGSGTCNQPAGFGTEHPGWGRCRTHGGNGKKQNNEHVRMLVNKKLEQGVYGNPVDIGPDEALLMEVHRTAGHVQWLGERIRDLGAAKGEGVLFQYSDAFGMQASVWLDMYQKERTHLVRVSKTAIDAGVAIRQVEIAQQQAQMMAAVMQAFIMDKGLGLDYRQQLNAKKIMREHLLNASNIQLPSELLPVDAKSIIADAQVREQTEDPELDEDMEMFL